MYQGQANQSAPMGVPSPQSPGGMQAPVDPLARGLQVTTQALRQLARDAAMQGANEISLDAEQMALKLRKHGQKRQQQFTEAQDVLQGASLASQL